MGFFPAGAGASEKGMDASGRVEALGMEWAGCMHEAERRPVNLARQLPADGRAAFETGETWMLGNLTSRDFRL